MRCLPAVFVIAPCFLAGCVVTLAPGADKVRITRQAPDVASCNTVGNLQAPKSPEGNVDIVNAEREIRNQTVGFGGNTALLTSPFFDQGIAYRCP